MKIRAFTIIVISTLVLGCSIAFLLPKACVTIKVVDDNDNPLEKVWVGVGFERNTGSGVTTSSVHGRTDGKGLFTAKGKTIKRIGYVINRQQEHGVKGINREGYYNTIGAYEFDRVVGGEWQPWNPEIKVYLRKIENPVPMYAREFSGVLPAIGKDIGLDLIAHDWVKPYGKGKHSDIIFYLKKRYVNDDDYTADIQIKFSRANGDGFISYPLNMYAGSDFKLPRYAPEGGYKKQFNRIHSRLPEIGFKGNENENIGYVFRIRSSLPNTVMYGKIQRDIGVRGGRGTAGISFTYYLNPDHTRNLEYDPKRNLFTDIKHYEPIGL